MIRQFYSINLKFEYNLNICNIIIINSADSLIVTMIPNML